MALAAAIYLVVAHATDRGPWFWVGLVLVALNVGGIVTQARSSRGPVAAGTPAPDPEAAPEVSSVRLVELLTDPAVAAAWASAPAEWVQVSYLDDPSGPVDPMPAVELAEWVWLSRDRWSWDIAVGDELKPFLDLDAPDDQDAVLGVLRAHPAVAEAWHEDREVYVVQLRDDLPLDTFAPLAARALAAGQIDAAGRLT